jgi:hypothetical protein
MGTLVRLLMVMGLSSFGLSGGSVTAAPGSMLAIAADSGVIAAHYRGRGYSGGHHYGRGYYGHSYGHGHYGRSYGRGYRRW